MNDRFFSIVFKNTSYPESENSVFVWLFESAEKFSLEKSELEELDHIEILSVRDAIIQG